MSKSNTGNTNENKKNIKKIAILAGAFALVGVGMYSCSGSSNNEQANVQTVGAQNGTGKPIDSQDKEYIDNIKERNASDAEKALEAGKSHVDTAYNKLAENVDENDFITRAQTASEQVLGAQTASEAQPINQVVEQRVIIKEVAVPETQAYDPLKDPALLTLLNNNRTPRTFTLTTVSNREQRTAQAEAIAKANEEKRAEAEKAAQNTDDTIVVAKVGDLIPATLQTPINSTRPSVIRAVIESGPLAGSVLTGTYQNNGTSVSVTFTSLNSPLFKQSIPINGLAMDYQTASTALASSVNRHIPERIIMAFAGSFAKGFSEAIKNNNTTVTERTVDDGRGNQSTIKTSGTRPKTTREINKESAAVAIDETADVINELIPKTPTVKVNANMEIAVYLSEDLVLNVNMFRDKTVIARFKQ